MKPVIGITGPAGSGKSLLAGMLERRGFLVLSLDALGHELLEEPELKRQLVEAFSTAILRVTDGAISRKKLSQMVFSEPRDMDTLNRIVHPHLIRRARTWIAVRRRREEAGLVEGALIFEFGLNADLDGVIVADAPFEVRSKRLKQTRGWSAERLAACDHAQIPVAEKIRRGGGPF